MIAPPSRAGSDAPSFYIEDRILDLRRMLHEESVLGEYGPAAIHRALESESGLTSPIPAVRTIARILERRGALDAKRRGSSARRRRPAGTCPTSAGD